MPLARIGNQTIGRLDRRGPSPPHLFSVLLAGMGFFGASRGDREEADFPKGRFHRLA